MWGFDGKLRITALCICGQSEAGNSFLGFWDQIKEIVYRFPRNRTIRWSFVIFNTVVIYKASKVGINK
jgi:hypothetical protein